MDEMNLLTSMRDEVPLAPPSPAAQRLFRAGLAEDSSPERVRAMRPQTRYLPGAAGTPGRLRWRLAIPGVAAVGLAAALVAVNLPQHGGTPAGQATVHPAAGTTMSAQLLADIAGKGILSHQQPVKPDQWIYQKIESYNANQPGAPSYAKLPVKPIQIQTQWTMADGAQTEYFANGHLINGLVPGPGSDRILADAAQKYEQLSSLPNDPAALYAYFAHKVGPVLATTKPLKSPELIQGIKQHLKEVEKPAQKQALENLLKRQESLPAPTAKDFKPPSTQLVAVDVFSDIENLLASGILPPSLTAELYHTLALIPGIVAKKDIKLVTGQSGVGFLLPQSPDAINLEIILSPTTFQYLGQASWTNPPYVWEKQGSGWSGPVFHEEVLLAQALVSAPGTLP